MSTAVIFDMDGTLFQTDKILEPALEETFGYLRSLNEWSGGTPIQQYREIMGVPLPVVWETLLPVHSEETRNAANRFFQEQLVTSIRNGQGALYPHAEEALSYLKDKGYSVFIASNGLIEYLQAIVHYYRLDRSVTETFSIEQIQSSNKADLVRLILEKHLVGKAAVVGDRLSDINAAHRNGLMAIGCRFDYAQEDELRQADAVIDELLELKDFF